MADSDLIWFAALLDLGNAACVGIDLAGRVAFWSRGSEALFGWTAAEVIGKPCPIIPPALEREWQLQVEHVLESRQATPAAETQRITRDGRRVSVVRTSSPVRNAQGEIAGLLDLLVDATALAQLDAESRALTQVREREAIAMDLHDGLVQSLYGAVLNLAAQEQSLGAQDSVARDAIRSARMVVERAIGETRDYIADLRARALTPRNLEVGLRLLADSLRLNAHVDVEVDIDATVEQHLAPEVRGQLLYLAREATSNVLRHAEAAHVRIALKRAAGLAELRIEDDGRGFDASTSSPQGGRYRGLHNMAERARLVGGRLEVNSARGGGTRVCLVLPTASSQQ